MKETKKLAQNHRPTKKSDPKVRTAPAKQSLNCSKKEKKKSKDVNNAEKVVQSDVKGAKNKETRSTPLLSLTSKQLFTSMIRDAKKAVSANPAFAGPLINYLIKLGQLTRSETAETKND